MPSTLKHDAAVAWRKSLAVLVGILLFSYFLSMALGLLLFYMSPGGLDVASRQVVELPLSILMIVNFRMPLGISAAAFFLVMWFLYVAAFACAWFDRQNFPSSFKDLMAHSDLLRSNYLVVLPQLASALLVAVVLLQTLQESAGIQTGGISFESPFVGFLTVSYAPLLEELSYRITTVGLFDALYLLWSKNRVAGGQGRRKTIHLVALTMWNPDRTKELLGFNTIRNDGLRKGISRFEWVLLVLTSGAFGAVHYLSGGGWEIGKISTAMLSGLAMGIVYLRYGAYAPILLHWFFNYYFGAFDLASQLNLAGAGAMALGIELLNLGVGTVLLIVAVGVSVARVWVSSRRARQVQGDYAGRSPNV